MKENIVLYGLIITLAVCTPFNLSADQKRTSLIPVIKYSFCTIYERGYSLSYVGKNWALQLSFASKSYPENSTAEHAIFRRGPGIHKYIRRPAGPRMPDPPDTREYLINKVSDISIEIDQIDINPDSNFGNIVASVNNFTLGEEMYYMVDPVTLICRVPNP